MNLCRRTRPQSDRFLPHVEALEDRQLLSANFLASPLPRTSPTSFLAGSVLSSSEPTVFRTSGAAFLEGSVLHVALSLPTGNEATLSDDGHGDVTVEWNGHTPPTFHGVREIVIDSLGQHDSIKYNLTGNVADRHEEVVVRLASRSSQFLTDLSAFRTKGLDFDVEPGADREGVLFQSGPVLFLGLSRAADNQATIEDDGHGDITVEWTGHPPQTFHHVSQVIIESLGRQDAIRYTLTGNVTKAHDVDVELGDPGSTFTPNLGGFQVSGLTIKVIPAPAKGP